jgi:two-component system, LuxR family, response regulator FixJ
MPTAEPTVFVVDDDTAMCESLHELLEAEGMQSETFASAAAFLENYQADRPGCLILDIRMRGMDGLELQAELVRRRVLLPIVFLTGHGDVPLAVRAVQAGAVDFLEKPVPDAVLLQKVRAALEHDARQRAALVDRQEIARRLAELTPREREVMDRIVAGMPNKQIASRLGVSSKTIEVHRQRILHKMGVHSAVALVRMVASLLPATLAGPPPG